MWRSLVVICIAMLCLSPLAGVQPSAAPKAHWTVVAWNDLGMHCMDYDYSVFSILPPFNNLHVQLIDNTGKLVRTSTGYTITYQGMKDPTGSITVTSAPHTNFWQYVLPIYGLSPLPDVGLLGQAMPGNKNTPQALQGFDTTYYYFSATGVPFVPVDSKGATNTYPMVRVVAKDSTGTTLATTVTDLPVSTEMTCIGCHASGSQAPAMPPTGWVYYPGNPDKDYKLNILLFHDELPQNPTLYQQTLVTAGYPNGLYNSATAGTPILCGRCHVSNALAPYGYTGIPGVPPLTQSQHSFHANVIDPVSGLPLNSENNRAACYNCHPGSTTKCLRGAMGSAIAPDGSQEMQCQDCHGNMSAVGATNRQGWLDEPNCQACHTGTAVQNNGQIRYTNAFDTNGQLRIPVNTTFATTPNVPSPPYSLFKESYGHGNLQCEACHGPTHAEYPTSEPNDNIQSQNLQKHPGPLADCGVCHQPVPRTVTGGPHGMHPTGQAWVNNHANAVNGGPGVVQCQNCHGSTYVGTVLSYSQGNRTLTSDYGTKTFFRGYQVSCYACHNGPGSDSRSPYKPPVMQNGSATTTGPNPVGVTLVGTDPNGLPLTYRIVSQPVNGTVAINGKVATYIPPAGFKGTDSFTFAAFDGKVDSNLGTISLTVN
jgi:Bacterial Ig domain